MKKQSLKNWSGITCVMGVDWGDSGKGRMIDDLSARADIIARYSGGSNTGHTVENQFGKFAFHIMPSGIFNQKAKCLIGRNVAVNLESLVKEINVLKLAGISYKNLVIDENASLTMPWHISRDMLREEMRSTKVGTTKNGVGPTYADRTERSGLLVKDLMDKSFEDKLKKELQIQNKFFNLKLNPKKVVEEYKNYAKIIKPYVANTIQILNQAIRLKKNILFEGAQGWLLDIDSGTYPYVTSSNPGVIGIFRSYNLHPSQINNVIGITKAYTTRVGAGPMPTKIYTYEADHIVEKGHEYGTTTGRKRDPGWLDLVLLKEACNVNKVTSLAITKLDVLSGLKRIKLATTYTLKGKKIDFISLDALTLSQYKPQYLELDGWDENISKIRDFNSLPKNAKNYINTIKDITGVPIKFISVGPKRGEIIYV